MGHRIGVVGAAGVVFLSGLGVATASATPAVSAIASSSAIASGQNMPAAGRCSKWFPFGDGSMVALITARHNVSCRKAKRVFKRGGWVGGDGGVHHPTRDKWFSYVTDYNEWS